MTRSDSSRRKEDRVQKFVEIYKLEFGEYVSTDEAELMLTRLSHLYRLLAKPQPSEIARRNGDEDKGTLGTL